MDIPQTVGDKLRDMLGREYEDYLESFTHGYGQTLRINRLKVKPADLIRRFLLEKRVPWCEDGFYYEGEERLSTSPYYHAGAYYLQEPSAMAPAAFLPVKPGDRILDLCAAPGGKTTALAGKLGDGGILISNDISASRCKALQKNVELAGISHCVITCESPDRLSQRFGSWFDGVLVDAPCSGEGMFRKDPAMMKNWSPQLVEEYSRLQREILSSAAKMVKPGGFLLYSTCTFSREEDEDVVSWLLDQDPRFRLQELPLYPGVERGRRPEDIPSVEADSMPRGRGGREELVFCRRFWPHKLDGEGQFAALLKKEGPARQENTGLSGQAEAQRATDGPVKAEAQRVTTGQIKTDMIIPDRMKPDKCLSGPGGGRPDKKTRKKGRKPGKGRKEIAGSEPVSLEAAEHFLTEIQSCALGEGLWLSWKKRLLVREERLFLLPAGCPDLGGLRVIRSGLYLGDCRKGRFEPSQALAMALRAEDYPRRLCLEENDPRLERYLRGETIEYSKEGEEDGSGYILVCLGDLPLGWGKADRGRIKNKYLPGWRKM